MYILGALSALVAVSASERGQRVELGTPHSYSVPGSLPALDTQRFLEEQEHSETPRSRGNVSSELSYVDDSIA